MKIKPSEITPEHIYLSRRRFMQNAGLYAGGAVLLAACGLPNSAVGGTPEPTPGTPDTAPDTEEPTDPLTSLDAVISYNNYYEFTTDKERVAALSADFSTSPWQVAVGGLVKKPTVFDVDDLLRRFDPQEQIYRMRCVEGWAMVIPWDGFPLSKLLAEVEPTSKAKYVRFETIFAPEEMPGQKNKVYPWPYIEGLRVDEAMNDLTLLATGLYGKTLLPQNGAPIRLVVPWKYGFKSIKSIVKIDLVEEMPVSLWMDISPREYGFYANVNPNVPHPRWSQASERRIGELGRRETLIFNGYGEQVAQLYEGMDLSVNF